MEKKVDATTSYKVDPTEGFKAEPTKINVKDKERIKKHKLAELGFGSMFYKTKTANGKTVFGEGKTSFLADKYKQHQNTLMFNFEKYMMSKPDAPTITMNDSDNSTNDDSLFGVNTTNRLKEEIKKNVHLQMLIIILILYLQIQIILKMTTQMILKSYLKIMM